MLKSTCYTLDWINKVRNANPPADPTIVEKTIYAFELLSHLVNANLDFIFKGGTSLLLLLENPQRLSIDIDISTSVDQGEIEEILDKIINTSVLESWEENPRTANRIPKKHYKIYFNSVINLNHNNYILLDVLFQDNPYPAIVNKPISNRFIDCKEIIECQMPSSDSLLGDKLTAFAPHTTGIPFGVGKSMQIQKQLFDVGNLFPLINNIGEVAESFIKFVEIESGYREQKITANDVINDIIEISFLLSQMNLRKAVSNEETAEFQDGISRLRSHLIGTNYNIETAKDLAAKAAFIASSISNQSDFAVNKIFAFEKLAEQPLTGKYAILERLKPILPEAYYYWQKTIINGGK